MSLIETAAKFDKMSENGLVKKVTERYLVDALSFGEAENKTFDRLKDYTSGELEVAATKKTKIAEIMGDKESDRFYLAKVAFVTIDEKTAAEKKTVSQWLIGAPDFAEAYKILKRGNRQEYGRHRGSEPRRNRDCGIHSVRIQTIKTTWKN